jgi:HYR domain/Secretion system C-terminal sorting domain
VNNVVVDPCLTETTPPTITCPANVVKTTTNNQCVTLVPFPIATATDNCPGNPSVVSNKLANFCFPVGTTSVTDTATDARGNKAFCSFNVTVNNVVVDPCLNDAIAPVLTSCPTNISLTTSNTTSICSWTEPKATDNCSTPSVSYTTSPTVGLTKGVAFPIGVTTVTYTATDAKGNKATCSFTVTVTNACAALSNSAITEYFINNTWYTGSSVTVNTGTSLIISANPNSLVSYIWTGPLGFYKIGNSGGDVSVSSAISKAQAGTYTVTMKDNLGCTASKSINIVVNDPCANDRTPPVFTNCPTTISVPVGLLSWCKSATWSTPTATDNCGTPVVVQASGQYKNSCFVPGTYAISYKATDAKGNISYCNFNVRAYKTLLLFLEAKDNLVMDAQAQVNRTYIEWVNNTGFKNDYFTVEKINNTTGKFEALETVNSQSSDSSATHYSTYDNAPNDGDNTYRVKVTFQDGSTKVSEPKTLNFKGLYDVRIFPNPASDIVGIDLSSYKNQAVEISMYNYLGQQISVQQVEKVGNAVVELNVANVQEGNYMIRIQSKGKRDITKIVNITH